MNEKGERLRTGKTLSRSRPVSPKTAGSWALEFIICSKKKSQNRVISGGQSFSHSVSHSARPDIPVIVHNMSVISGAQCDGCAVSPSFQATVLSVVHNHDPWLCNNFYVHQAKSTRIRGAFKSPETES